MAYKGVIEDFQAIRRRKMPKRIPCTAASEEFDVKWFGKYTYEEFCQDGNKMVEVTRAAVEHFDYDWAWLQIDDCFEFEPIGVGVKGEGNILRATYKYLPVTRDVLGRVRKMDAHRAGRIPEKLRALKNLKEHFGDTVLVVGSCAAPFSAVGLMWSIEESMLLMLTDKDLLHDAMETWKEFYQRYIRAQQEAGADAIWLGDCNAFSSMVSVDLYNEHILPVTKELIQYCEKELDIMIWLHNSEIEVDHVRSHFPLGYSFENIGPDADMKEIRQATKGRVPISGNIDPIKVLWKGTPEIVEREVERIIGACKDGGGYIFSSGEMIPRDTPKENISAMLRTVKRLGAY
jgi:[methyl-Co(III) methylamine-specific corrinoid protein]:coenzyme M methyltransferase